jgi:hypothetical protein
VAKWEAFDGKTRNVKDATKKVKDLRTSWLMFMKDPQAYLEYMREVY